jgi:hypothetical protein
MAKTYTVRKGQNIFDVALHIYGSIEGVFDLLSSNEELGYDTELTAGTKLTYNEGYVISSTVLDKLSDEGLRPVNGERGVYFKSTTERLCAFGHVGDVDSVSFRAQGAGYIIVDWGDNTDLEVIKLATKGKTTEHVFDDELSSHIIKIYGNTFGFHLFDTTNLCDSLYLTAPIVAYSYITNSTAPIMDSLFLFNETTNLDLQGCKISDLSSVISLDQLQTLNLQDARFASVSVIDDYLAELYKVCASRIGCKVYLTTPPSKTGLAIINKIITDPVGKERGWEFYINDTVLK